MSMQVNHARRAGDAQGFAQERRFLGVALDQMRSARAFDARKRAGEDDTGKAAAAAEIDPGSCMRRELEKLQGIGDVAGPELRQRRRRDEIGFCLPLEQQLDVGVEPRLVSRETGVSASAAILSVAEVGERSRSGVDIVANIDGPLILARRLVDRGLGLVGHWPTAVDESGDAPDHRPLAGSGSGRMHVTSRRCESSSSLMQTRLPDASRASDGSDHRAEAAAVFRVSRRR